MPGIISRTSTPLPAAMHRAFSMDSSMARYGEVMYTMCLAPPISCRNASSAEDTGLLSGPSAMGCTKPCPAALLWGR